MAKPVYVCVAKTWRGDGVITAVCVPMVMTYAMVCIKWREMTVMPMAAVAAYRGVTVT